MKKRFLYLYAFIAMLFTSTLTRVHAYWYSYNSYSITADTINNYRVDTIILYTIERFIQYDDSSYIAIGGTFLTGDSMHIVQNYDLQEDGIWILEPTGKTNSITKTPTFYLRNFANGRYISGKEDLTHLKRNAWDFTIISASDTTWGVSPNQAYPFQVDFIHFAYENDSIIPQHLTKYSIRVSRAKYIEEAQTNLINHIDSLKKGQYQPENYCKIGTGLGEVPEEEYNKLNETYNKASNITLTDGLHPEAYRQAQRELYNAYEHIDSIVGNLPDGYYRFRKISISNTSIHYDAYMNSDGDGDLKKEGSVSDNLGYTFFLIKKKEEGGYTIQNIYDSLYMGTSSSVNEPVSMTTAPEYTQHIVGDKLGTVALWSSKLSTSNLRYYYGGNTLYRNSNSKNFVVARSNERSFDTRWEAQRIEDADVIKSIKEAQLQLWWERKKDSLERNARKALTKATFCEIDQTKPLITDAGQLYCNNLNDTQYDHDLGSLLDNDINTRIRTAGFNKSGLRYIDDEHTAPEDSAYHYIQVHTSSPLPDSLALWWTIVASSTAPTCVSITVSRDGENWVAIDTLTYPWIDLPIDNASPEYISPSPIYLQGNDYTYLRMTVLNTQKGSLSVKGFPFFALSGFNLYPVTNGTSPQCQILRPEVKAAADNLQKVLYESYDAEAYKDLVPQTTPELYSRLEQTYNNFMSVWSDTTLLQEYIQEARTQVAQSVEGDEIGKVEPGATDQLQNALDAVERFRPYYLLTRKLTDSLTNFMSEALEAFSKQLNLPEENSWYFLTNKWVSSTIGTESQGLCLYASAYNAKNTLYVRGLPKDNEQNSLAAWRFVPINKKEKIYGIQCLGSGWYLGGLSSSRVAISDTIVPYRFTSLGNGQIGLSPVGTTNLLTPSGIGYLIGNRKYNDGRQAWDILPVDEERMTDIKNFSPSSYTIVTVPYGMRLVPKSKDATLEWYTLCGTKREQGKIVALKLKRWNDVLESGRPYIVKVGASQSDGVYVDMCIDLYNEHLDTAAVAENGLHGTLRDMLFFNKNVSYFKENSDKVTPSKKNEYVQIDAHSGYIILNEVEDLDEEADEILGIEGENLVGLPILKKDIAPKIIDIYTTDGILLRHNVIETEINSLGLAPGIYIVGKKKLQIR